MVLAVGLAVAPSAHAQILVTDVLALTEKITETVLQEAQKAIRQLQAEKVYKMAIRLSEWVDLGRYYIHRDDMPEWRIHNWFTDDVLYAKPFNFALTYGDSTGTGYESVTVRRRPTAVAFTSGYTAEAEAILRSNFATLDLVDSAIVRDTHTAGQHRFGGRADAEAIINLQEMVLEKDPNASLAAALDQVSAGQIVTLQSQQTRAQLETALLEQLIIEGALEREADVAVNNMRLTQMRTDDEEGEAPSVAAGATAALQGWHLR